MKIAILSDIHDRLTQLKKALEIMKDADAYCAVVTCVHRLSSKRLVKDSVSLFMSFLVIMTETCFASHKTVKRSHTSNCMANWLNSNWMECDSACNILTTSQGSLQTQANLMSCASGTTINLKFPWANHANWSIPVKFMGVCRVIQPRWFMTQAIVSRSVLISQSTHHDP